MNEMNERFRLVRQDKGLSQTDFGKPLGLSRDEVKNIEHGKTTVKELTIPIMCREFNINEEWLRTGEGEMYVLQTKRQQLASFLGEVMYDDGVKSRIISALSTLPVEYWEILADIATRIAEECKDKKEESGD